METARNKWVEQNKSLSNYHLQKEMTGGRRIIPQCLEATFVDFSVFVFLSHKKINWVFCTNFPPGLSELRHEVRRLETQVWINWSMSSFHFKKVLCGNCRSTTAWASWPARSSAATASATAGRGGTTCSRPSCRPRAPREVSPHKFDGSFNRSLLLGSLCCILSGWQ